MKKDPVLFARIGYMHFYSGPQSDDERPLGGGKYNASNVGHEVYNFKVVAGRLYGYVQPVIVNQKESSINLERVAPIPTNENAVTDCLVVFVARSSIYGQVIVGWYEGATVFRASRLPKSNMQRGKFRYYFEADAKKAVLLPERLRTHRIPSGMGAFGRSNVCYALDSKGNALGAAEHLRKWRQAAIAYVEAYEGPNLLQDAAFDLEDTVEQLAENDAIVRSGQGFQIDPRTRKQIEDHAVRSATKYYVGKYTSVENVGSTKSYDLECKRRQQVLRVEVKGTQTSGKSIILTRNEVENARKHNVALYVLHSIGWKGTGKQRKPSGGRALILDPWHIQEHGSLDALAYSYDLADAL